jgi:hypothetical protein
MVQRLLFSAGAVLVATTILYVVSLLAPPPAAAHRDPTLSVRMTNVDPELPTGAQVEVLDGERTYLGLTNRTPTSVSVLDPEGIPFLYISSQGVLGDVDSPYLAAPRAVVESATSAPPDCCPDGHWMLLSDQARWAWPDPRLDPPLRDRGAGEVRGLPAISSDEPLATWEIPLRIRDQEFLVEGVLERRVVGAVTTTVESAPAGLDISVVESRPPQLQLEVVEGVSLQVLGKDGRQFIRMSSAGAFARTASSDYQASRRAIGLAPAVGLAWAPMPASGPTKIVWADSRIDYQALLPTDRRSEAFVLNEWEIQVVVDGRAGEIRGKSVWEPVPVPALASTPKPSFWESGGTTSYAVVGVLTLLLLCVVLLARRRVGMPRQQSEDLTC